MIRQVEQIQAMIDDTVGLRSQRRLPTIGFLFCKPAVVTTEVYTENVRGRDGPIRRDTDNTVPWTRLPLP